MKLSEQQLLSCMPNARLSDVQKYLPFFNEVIEKFQINTPKRLAAFLAQVGHESGSLRHAREIASGEAYDTGRLAANLGNTPEKDGDGQKYKGRGLIQITGRTNYRQVSTALGFDFIKEPEKLEQPKEAVYSAAWFWKSRNLNLHADKNEFERITRRINGGLNGQQDRLNRWAICRKVLDVKEVDYD